MPVSWLRKAGFGVCCSLAVNFNSCPNPRSNRLERHHLPVPNGGGAWLAVNNGPLARAMNCQAGHSLALSSPPLAAVEGASLLRADHCLVLPKARPTVMIGRNGSNEPSPPSAT